MAWAAWEQDNSLFHGETGETHVLSELPALLLHAMAQGPKTEQALCALAAAQCEVASGSPWRQKIHGILLNLEQLELVEQTTQAAS
jgi:PqqD family protein of HPr-rel-A system